MFVYGVPAKGEYFFGRKVQKKEVGYFVEDSVDFMLKAPRRYGKTSLILEVLRGKKYIYLDYRRVSRPELLINEMLDQVYSLIGIEGFFKKAKKNLLSLIKEVKVSGKIDLSFFETGIEVVLADHTEEDICVRLANALDLIDGIGEELGEKIIIVNDEFQDIKRFDCEGDVLETLRGTLQHKENIHSIFLGSIESIMTSIFEDKKSPFFNYCRKMKLAPFDSSELAKELVLKFRSKGIVFENDKVLTELIDELGGHPGNTMLTMQHLYNIARDSEIELIKKEHALLAYQKAYEEQIDLIEQYVIELNNKKHYHDVMYRIANNEKQTLTSQALWQVRKGLENMGHLIVVGSKEYKIVDSFLEAYLKEK